MNNDKSLIIVEAAQSPQVVAVSDVSAAEIEFQHAFRQCRDLINQIEEAGNAFVASQKRLVDAWMAENYPGLSYTVTPTVKHDNSGVFVGTTFYVDSPMFFTIAEELNVYLDQIRR